MPKWIFNKSQPRTILIILTIIGAIACLYRMLFGLGAATNLTDQWPWGMWVWWDVMVGVALAGGGYSTALLVNFLGREKWKSLERAAFLTSLIGYLLVVGGLFLDLGRWINVWRVPLFWEGNMHSVMFELVWCVTGYTLVQIVEFGHIYVEKVRMPRLENILHKIYVPVLTIGVILPFLHQSALGSLYIIAKGRLDPLWWSMMLPVFFLMSSFFVGPAMVTVEGYIAAKFKGHRPPITLLRQMLHLSGILMLAYLALKIGDLAMSGELGLLFAGTTQSIMLNIELMFGILVPAYIFLDSYTRQSMKWLFAGASLTVLGVALNRANVVFTGMMAQADGATYLPSLVEVAITVGLVSAGILAYNFVTDNFPIYDESYIEPEIEVQRVTNVKRVLGFDITTEKVV